MWFLREGVPRENHVRYTEIMGTFDNGSSKRVGKTALDWS